MLQDVIHNKIVENCSAVENWFAKKSVGLNFPIYSSFDIRDSGWKVAPVDANIFPAGFNNICPVDKENAPEILKNYLSSHYSGLLSPVALLAEEHTNNAYYWENVSALVAMFTEAGLAPMVCVPRELSEPLHVKSVSGKELVVYGARNEQGEIWVNDQKVNLIICNNDFSESYPHWSKGLVVPMNPPHELGWYKRKKHSFFKQYNSLAAEFGELIGISPQLLQIETQLFEKFDIQDEDRIEALAVAVDLFLSDLREKYEKLEIAETPFCFVKNNAGTYGLAVIQVASGQEVREWNYKDRKKMKAAKGGREVTELIIQEGIPTRFRDDDGGAAEPCIYLVGRALVGGFLRTHSKKGPVESLNSPGAVYKRLCMSDLEINLPGCPMENVYGWTSRLAALAIALEAKDADVPFRGYRI